MPRSSASLETCLTRLGGKRVFIGTLTFVVADSLVSIVSAVTAMCNSAVKSWVRCSLRWHDCQKAIYRPVYRSIHRKPAVFVCTRCVVPVCAVL
jgi:hypothetical protein